MKAAETIDTMASSEKTEYQKMTYLEAIGQAQKEEMQRDENIILIGEDIPLHGNKELFTLFGQQRMRCTPISENSFTGMGVGAALTGLRPIVDLTIASFVYLASDQIINQAAKLRYMTGGQLSVPLVIRACMYYNVGTAAQHSDRPYSFFMNAPGLKIIVPSTPADAKGLLKSAIRDNDPVMVFEDVNLWTKKEMVSTDPEALIPLGKADVKRSGSDVTIVSIGACLYKALKAADILQKQGISVEVVDPRTLVPLDTATIVQSVEKTGRLVIVDHAHRCNSAASEISAVVAEHAFSSLLQPIQRVTTPDIHIPSSQALESTIYPEVADIVAAVKRVTPVVESDE